MFFKKLFISILILPIIFLFHFMNYDTGVLFSFHYLKNKIVDDYRINQNLIKEEKLSFVNSSEEKFNSKIGLINNNFNKNFVKTSKKISSESLVWLRSNGGNSSNKFSNYDQINYNNIDSLKLLWKFDSSKNLLINKKWKNNIEINPIFYDGLVYLATPYKEILAIDILTGKLIWKFNSLKKIDSRGMTFWLNKKDQNNSCIFVPIRDTVFCINYKTGKRIKNFGNDGFIKSGLVRAAPVIWNDLLIVATLDTQKIKAFSALNGDFKWEISIHPQDKNFKGGTPWGGISLDSKRNLLFVSTGNPRPALYGASRIGNNKNSNSILAFDLINKKIKWSFQEVSHDLWDYDIASPPLLASLDFDKIIIDVVIVMTKIGNTFILKRETGEPLFDVYYKNAPQSDVINEHTSSMQISRNLPESTIKFEFDVSDLDNRNLDDRDLILNNIDNYKFGWFEPPSLNKTLLLYGLHGGAQWPGGVFDPYSENLFLPVNQIPWKIRLFLSSDERHPNLFEKNYKVYKNNCSSCHGLNRNGKYKTEKEREINFIPNLIDIYNNKYPNSEIFYSKVDKHHKEIFIKQELNKVYKLFKEWDKKIYDNKSSMINFQWSQFLYKDDLPATIPPWGKIVSLNLKNGLINWQVPNGYVGSKKLGTANFGGIIATKGGLLFVTGTDDNKIIALNSKNGNELWSYEMDSAGSTSPTMAMWKDKQILIVIASGGRYHNYKDKSGSIYAFSIK